VDIKKDLKKEIENVLTELNIINIKPELFCPEELSNGDYATNVAMVVFADKKLKPQLDNFRNPRELAEKIVKILNTKYKIQDTFDRVETAGPGFINFHLSANYLGTWLEEVLRDNEKLVNKPKSPGGKIVIEYAHPNTHKMFHIGHLRNITLGESLVRLLDCQGAEVIRANYQGDVGLHIAKALYGFLHDSNIDSTDQISRFNSEPIEKRIKLLGQAYASGAKAYEEEEKAQEEIRDINYLIYASAQRFQQENGVNPGSTDYMHFVKGRNVDVDKIYNLWKTTRQWSLDYFETIYKRVYTHYDRYFFESECLGGVDLAKEALGKGILKEDDGAIIFDGKPYGLDTRVFVNSLGLPTYEGKELALAAKEFSEFGNINKLIHVVGPEQASFFKITFKAEELLDPEKYKDKQYHFTYGWVRLKKGKMSSRTGKVVLGEWLLNEVKKKLQASYKMEESIAEAIAIGAVKYSILKVSPLQEIIFDIDESISLDGNSGPYLQYAYARTQSILGKAQNASSKFKVQSSKLGDWEQEKEESDLLRYLFRYSDVVNQAADSLSPNVLCNYLFNLAQRFNLFYQKHKVIGSKEEEQRLVLVKITGLVLKNGLNILGIEAPEKV
jgi:arginyl-tRNA synthetase